MGKQTTFGKTVNGTIKRTSRRLAPYRRLLPSTGFTLIEVLLSFFLVALISGILFASFFLPLRAVSAAKLELVKVEEAAVFLTRFSEEIAAAYKEITAVDTDEDIAAVDTGVASFLAPRIRFIFFLLPARTEVWKRLVTQLGAVILLRR